MRKILTLIRATFLMIGLGLFSVAAVGVMADRADRKDLPTRIGQPQQQLTFWQELSHKSSEIWTDFYVTFLPGLVPETVAYDRNDPASLDALRTRTRNLANGLTADGRIDINSF